MIAANELRIGNWVKYFGTYLKIDLSTFYGMHGAGHGMKGVSQTETLFEGIELTPEILEKCGFKLVSKHSFWNFQNKNGFYVSMWMEDEPIAGFEKKGCCYADESYTEISTVHWLQNYYFFNYRKELEINLNNQP